MLRGRLDHLRRERERGNIIVLFALFLMVLLALGSVVLDVGNWFVLKRHLQTQVDAAALAGGPKFTWCTQGETLARTAISQESLKYAGDPTRETQTDNQLMQDTGDVHAVLNSSTYWATGDKTDGTTLDWTSGAACTAKYLDVKATDEKAPLLWGWIPFFPDLKTRARVEISQIESSDGLRPLGVPEVDPEQVAVLFVDEDGSPSSAASIRGWSFLDEQTTPPTGLESMAVWSKSAISPVAINGSSQNFNVIVVTSRSPSPINIAGLTLSQICNQNPTQTQCYGGQQLTDGLSFIHAYPATGGPFPAVRNVTLDGGCTGDLSRPYFNLEGGCPIGITAEIDFGTGGNDPEGPVASGGVCAEVRATPGGPMTYAGGVWTASFTPPTSEAGGGPQEVDLSWETDTNGGCGGSNNGQGTFNSVQQAYVSDEPSGPVEYIKVEHVGGGSANSMPHDPAASFNVTVGFTAPLRTAALSDPPIPLRFWDTPSQTQALDCNTSGSSGWGEAMVNGCIQGYQIYDEAKHVSKCGPPPAGVPAADPPDCIDSQNGNYHQKDVIDMLTPCAQNPNRWDGMTIPPDSDKRWMPLFVLDQLAFKVSGKRTYPVRRFGMFYVTAASGLNCPGDVPAIAPNGKREMWGHFISYITPGLGETIPSIVPCSFEDGGLCVSNLVE
jgi:Putative Flp pilus-assembly TadE/G-like